MKGTYVKLERAAAVWLPWTSWFKLPQCFQMLKQPSVITHNLKGRENSTGLVLSFEISSDTPKHTAVSSTNPLLQVFIYPRQIGIGTNSVAEFHAFGEITGVNTSEVQCMSLIHGFSMQ